MLLSWWKMNQTKPQCPFHHDQTAYTVLSDVILISKSLCAEGKCESKGRVGGVHCPLAMVPYRSDCSAGRNRTWNWVSLCVFFLFVPEQDRGCDVRMHKGGIYIKELLLAPFRCGLDMCVYTFACDLHTNLKSGTPSGHALDIPAPACHCLLTTVKKQHRCGIMDRQASTTKYCLHRRHAQGG